MPEIPGSSPRMRGALGKRRVGVRRAGIIPAYAGSTSCTRIAARPGRDHPRVCGEHARPTAGSRAGGGSSPRMRGARDTRHRHGGVRRIIPAYAGSTFVKKTMVSTWGGIIPAYAGSTFHNLNAKASERDHPRVCGEHLRGFITSGEDEGSSPRMRGALRGAVGWLGEGGIIPAYAGSTRQAPCRCPPRRDHPRVCGEHRLGIVRRGGAAGSSPRMRGALLGARAAYHHHGVIPAYAGSTRLSPAA